MKDYMEKYNYNPKIWGPNAWRFLHMVALSYPTIPTSEDKKAYKSFFLGLGKILPCHKCQNNFAEHIKKFDINKYLDSPDSLFEWVLSINNEINTMLGKSTVGIDSMKNMYNRQNNYFVFYRYKWLILFSVCSIGFFILKRYYKLKISIGGKCLI